MPTRVTVALRLILSRAQFPLSPLSGRLDRAETAVAPWVAWWGFFFATVEALAAAKPALAVSARDVPAIRMPRPRRENFIVSPSGGKGRAAQLAILPAGHIHDARTPEVEYTAKRAFSFRR